MRPKGDSTHPATTRVRFMDDDLRDWEALAAPAFGDLWWNEAHEIWDSA